MAGGERRIGGAPSRCQACERELIQAADIGWECECGVIVCAQDECIAEYFKFVAGGEGTRCLSCGALL
jgi:hypothetical protein